MVNPVGVVQFRHLANLPRDGTCTVVARLHVGRVHLLEWLLGTRLTHFETERGRARNVTLGVKAVKEKLGVSEVVSSSQSTKVFKVARVVINDTFGGLWKKVKKDLKDDAARFTLRHLRPPNGDPVHAVRDDTPGVVQTV